MIVPVGTRARARVRRWERIAFRWSLPVALLLCVTAAAAAAPGSRGPTATPLVPPGAARVASAEFVPGELIVRFKPTVGSQARAALLKRFGASVGRNLGLPDLALVRLAAGSRVAAAAAAFARDPQILYAEPNYYRRISATPNDTRFGELVGLHNTGQLVNGFAGAPDADIDAPEAWDIETGDPNVVVAVIDTGGAFDHPDLAGNVWSNPGENGATASEGPAPNCTSRGLTLDKSCNNLDDDGNTYVDDRRGWDWVGGDPSPRDLNGHGTHVGGTVGGVGNNSSGVAGVSWEVRLMFLRVLDASGSGSTADIISAFNYAGAKGAHVVNGSFGGGPFSAAEQDAINAWPNTLFVFAAGNDGTNNDTTPAYPCSYASVNIVCVAATDPNDARADFSNFGASSVDLGAPGVNTLSTLPAFAQLWSDDFETADTWTTGGDNNTWARTTEVAAPSPTNSLTDSPGGSYLNNTNSWAQRVSAFSLTGQSDCRLDYFLRLATQPPPGPPATGDVLWIETSTDAGATWSIQSGYAGSTGGFFFSVQDELFGVGAAASVLVRYRLATNSSVTSNGAHIDDAGVQCLSSTFGPSDFAFLNGTSMASPHVAGAAALVIARSLSLGVSPAITTSQVKTILLESVDPLPSLAGATPTVTGGRLNLFKAVSGFCGAKPATKIGSLGNDVINGTAGADVIVGLGGDDRISGFDGNDLICGGDGNDEVIGGGGADTIDGGGGWDEISHSTSPAGVSVNLATGSASDGFGFTDVLSNFEDARGSPFADTIAGSASANALTGAAGADTIAGGDGNDRIFGGDGGSPSLDGGVGNDLVMGGAGGDTILGGDGFDTMRGLGGADSLDGGPSYDLADYSGSPAGVNINLETGSGIDGFGSTDTVAGVEHVIGTPFPDTLTGDAAANELEGRDGDDTISGSGGDDRIFGGEGGSTGGLSGGDGNDLVVGGSGADVLNGNGGHDLLVGLAGVDTIDGGADYDFVAYLNSPASVNVNLSSGTAADGFGATDAIALGTVEAVLGSDFGDTITGDGAANTLVGFAGADSIAGGLGNDQIDGGGGGSPSLDGGPGDDRIRGGSGIDNLLGGDGSDVLIGDAGADTLDGGAGFDFADYSGSPLGVAVNLATGSASDGFAATDTIALGTVEAVLGSAFADNLTGDDSPNELLGNDGFDTIAGGGGSDRIAGGEGGSPLLDGGPGNDWIHGGSGLDTLFGGDGIDFLVGHAGTDTLDGGPGFDFADYSSSPAFVNANLMTGVAMDGFGTADTLMVGTLEALIGSAFDDFLTGDALPNVLDGGPGIDQLDGAAGVDQCLNGETLFNCP